MKRQPTRSTLFPYTTLFRSHKRKTRRRIREREIRFIPWFAGVSSETLQMGRHCFEKNMTSRGHDAMCTDWKTRSEEHTSELQSQFHLVCRLLLEKKKDARSNHTVTLHTAEQVAYLRAFSAIRLSVLRQQIGQLPPGAIRAAHRHRPASSVVSLHL